MTAAALYRSIGDPAPTVLFDEVQELFGRRPTTTRSELRAVLNAGYRLGGAGARRRGRRRQPHRGRVPGLLPQGARRHRRRCPTCWPTGPSPSGCSARPATDTVERFRIRRSAAEAEALRDRLAGWAATALPKLNAADPSCPTS